MNVEHQLREVLRDEAEAFDTRPVPWSQLQRRAVQARRARWVAGGLSVVAAVAAVTLVSSTLGVDRAQQVQVTDGARADVATTGPDAPATTVVAPTPRPEATPTTEPAPPTTTAPTTTPTTTTPPSTPPTTAPARPTTTTTSSPDPVCAGAEGGSDQPVTQAEFESRIAHAWQLCAAPSVFGTDEAGLEIRSDHRWSKLARSADGRYVRMQGWGNEGTWDSLDTSSMNGPGYWQLNLHIDGGGVVVTLPVFARNVPKMRLNNNGVYVADYRPLPAGAVSA